MTRKRNILTQAVCDVLDVPVSSDGLRREDAGVLIELVTGWPAVCPHCHKTIPAPVTRRRRLRRVMAGRRMLALEIDG